MKSVWVARRFVIIVIGALGVLTAGCPSATPPATTAKSPKQSAGDDSDDPAAVAALKEHKAGLTLDKEGHVVAVDLDNAAGGDADLAQIKRLPRVRTIDCTEVRGVTDAGMAMLEGHPSLRGLKLERSMVTDAGMPALQKIPNFEDLDIRRLGITLAGYKEIGKIKGLKRLRVVYNSQNFKDDCLEAIKDLKNLELLDMQDCNLPTEKGLAVLESFPKLRFVRMYGPNVTDKVIGYLKGAKDLRVLSLEQCSSVSPEAFDTIGQMSNLTELSLFGALKTNDAAVGKLSSLTKMQTLELRQTLVTSAALSHLKGMKSLKSLNVEETAVGNEGLAHIQGLTALEELNLRQSQVDDKGLAYLKNLTKLQRLNLDKCNITNDGLVNLKPLKNLDYLHIGSTHVTDAGLPHLYGLKKLTKVDLTYLSGITDEGVDKLQAELPDAEIER
jgi:Leucine-rich repeat (LRR) protein